MYIKKKKGTDKMLITERIAQIIEEMLNRQNGIAELRRNELANTLGCVPSQINYVITSRFNKERGYIVESRRGGGGYIKIIRPEMTGSAYLCHMLGVIGDAIDADSAVYLTKDMYAKDLISEREARIIMSVLSNKEVYDAAGKFSPYARAEMFKSIILTLIQTR